MADDKSLFISSLSRRELARRRPTRSVIRIQIVVALLVLAAGIVALVAVHGIP
jgi:hypothetical protein